MLATTVLWLLGATSAAYAQSETRYQQNITGGVTLAGNAFYTTSRNQRTTTQVPADTDGDPTTTLSSSADLILPPGSTIVRAYLYVEMANVMSATLTEVKFRVPGAAYATLTAGTAMVSRTTPAPVPVGTFPNSQQLGFDVTALLPANGYVSSYTAGGSASTAGRYTVSVADVGSMGGWLLMVVYANPASKYRSITVADNWGYFSNSAVTTDVQDVQVPASGTVTAVVGVTGTWGDNGYSDYVAFGLTTDNPQTNTSLRLTNPNPTDGPTYNYPQDDALNSSIGFSPNNNVSADGGPTLAMSGCWRARNPYQNFVTPYPLRDDKAEPGCSAQYDASIFDAAGKVAASATPIDVRLTQRSTGGDNLFAGAFFVSIDLAPPSLTKSLTPGTIMDGGTTTYTFTIDNSATGTLAQNGLGFTDTLPSAIRVANPANATINGTTGAPPIVTAAPDSTSVQVAGLNVAAGAIATVTVDVTNVPGQVNLSCAANPEAFTNGGGSISGITGTISNNVPPVCLVVTPAADLSIEKTDGTITYVPGTNTVYTIVVSNSGPSAVTGAQIIDALPAGITSASWTCASGPGAACGAASGTGGINSTANLAAGASVTYTLTIAVPSTASGTLTNIATVAPPAGTVDSNGLDNEARDADTATPVADLTITKVSTPNPYVPGEPLMYTIIVSNVGPSTVTGATVSDPLPAVVTSANWNWTCTPNNAGGVCGAANANGVTDITTTVTLSPGGSVTFVATGTIASSTTGILTNTARVTEPSGVSDPTPLNNGATDTNNASLIADLWISKTGSPNPFVPGEPLSYTIVAGNAGPSDAVGARVQDAFPAAFAGFTWQCTPSAGAACGAATGTMPINILVDLPVGETVTFQVTGTVPSSFVTRADNSATITSPSDMQDPVPGNNVAVYENATNLVADLAITKTQSSDLYVPGTAMRYTLLVQNVGPSDVTNARVQDVIPGVITGVTWTCAAAGTGAACASPAGVNVVDALVTLPVGTTATFTITGTIASNATGILTNTGRVTAPTGVTDPVPGNNESTVNSGGGPLADLAIVKTASQNPYTPGAALTFTIVVSNNGPSDAPNAHVEDLFVPMLSSFTWSCAPSAGAATCSVAGGMSMIDTFVDLPVGGAVTFTAIGTVMSDSVESLTNTATVAPPIGVNDPNDANNLSAVTLGAAPQVDLQTSKTSTPNPYVAGTPITYTIVVANDGPSAALGARVRDGLPPVLQNVTWACSAAKATCPADSGSGNVDALVDIDIGGTVTFTIQADVPVGTRGALVNAATVVPPQGTIDRTPNNNTGVDTNPTIVLGGPVDLRITQEFPSVAPPNGLLTFRLRTRNLGPGTALNPYITGLIPPGTTFVSVNPGPGGIANTPGNPPAPDPVTGYPIPGAATEPLRVTWPGLMKPGESHVVEFTVRVAPGTPTGQILWSCFWTWPENEDTYHANNVVDAYLFVDDGTSPVGDLAIQAGALSEGVIGTTLPTRVGVPVPMRFWVTNHGPAATRGQYALILDTANTIQIVDVQLPQGWVSPSGPSSAVWDTGVVQPGQTVALDLAVRVLTPGAMELFAQRISGSPGDPNASNERATIVLDGYAPGYAGRRVAVGNADGAGAGEIITAAGQGETPQVRVFSGTGADTGVRFFAYERPFLGGVEIASCDVDGDGFSELITAPGPGRAPTIRVLSLVGGVVTELIAFDTFEASFTGGASIACADLDADGAAELIIGAGPGRASEVQVYNVGLSSTTLRATFLAYEVGFLGGVRVAAGVYPGRAGWLDAFAIATTPGPGRAAELRLFTPLGAPVAQVVVSSATKGVLPTLGDVNGDGHLDLLLAPDDGRPELVRIFEVDSGEVLGDVPGGSPAFPVGIRTAVGLLDGGPDQPEIVIGSGPGGHPRVRVIYWPPAGPVQRLEILPLEIP